MKRKITLLICIVMLLSLGLYGCQRQEPEKEILEISYCRAAPNYELQLYEADDVIYGEVIEELESYYSNPDRADKNLENAWITPYIIQVEKAYKGIFKEGDTVLVCAWNKVGIYPEDEEKYIVVTDQIDFYMHEGQRGVFMVQESYLKTEDGGIMYDIVYQNEGVFEEKETGTATMNEPAKKTYVSPSFEITLEQIPDDIAKLPERYGYMSQRDDPTEYEI